MTATITCQACGCDGSNNARCEICGAALPPVDPRSTPVQASDWGASDNIENALVGQKNDLICLINYANDGTELAFAERTLRMLSPMWHALGYGYKTRELRQRIVSRANELLADGARKQNRKKLEDLAAL